MKLLSILATTTILTAPAFAEESRHLDSHEHGVGELNIAFDGAQIALELHAPGADIVGFEYAAETPKDRAAVDAAVATLAAPLNLFALPASAGCSVVQASAGLESEDDHGEHGEEGHEDHGEEDHGEEGHEDHADEAGHTEFHAEYLLSCADVSKVTEIAFDYFDAFPGAKEVEVQLISDAGAKSFEVERDAPVLDLRGMF